MNVLLTSVGRRAYLVKYFQEILGKNGEVHVSNSDDKTVAFHYADHSVISPMIYDEGYIPFLLTYCKEHGIDVLISLFDIDLPVLARHKEAFATIGTRVIVSDAKFVDICNDKWKTYEFLKEHDFYVPKTYCTFADVSDALERGDVSYPIIIKPRFGCGSIALLVAEDKDELLYLKKKVEQQIGHSYLKFESATVPVKEQILYQERLDGQEYGADIINDLEGVFQNAIIKKKVAMRAGETDIAELVNEPVLYQEAKRLGELTGHIANLDCDLFLVDGLPYVLEMNARFGGGYPFSHIAGCNLPKAICLWSENKYVDQSLLSVQTNIKAFKEIIITKV